MDCCCNEDLCCLIKKYIGQTVTIFTNSGGLSGSGFTGVVIGVDDCFVRLLTRVGGAPDCPIGSDCGYPSSCGDGYGGYAYGSGRGYGTQGRHDGHSGRGCGYYNLLGSVTAIPLTSIASFVHNAI